jgi:hypothetical protein
MRAHSEGDRSIQPLSAERNSPTGPTRRGPKTSAGKEMVKLNAVRHGLGVTSPVIPGVENPEAWKAHRVAMVKSLVPFGYLETVLARRVALEAWRLSRITRYEVACVVDKASDGLMDDEADQLLPDPEEVDRIIRYEAHLSREFYRALHELEAQQRRRHGKAAPLARVDIQGLPEA